MLTIVIAGLVLAGVSVVVVDRPVAANRSRNRRLGGILLAATSVFLLAVLLWAASHWL